MDSALKSLRGINYIDLTESDSSIEKEGDLNDLLSLCYYHNSNLLLLSEKNLSSDFYNLKSGLAGAAMQKFANYQAKVAIILATNAEQSNRFKELMFEMSRSNHFRFYDNREDAEIWLTT
ncbi:MAG: DUF4180 domain-containing protein [Candidatus Marinimicrobia bacterium]|jgi:PadR family transcriptional regulator, regulatory protein AphA|nr:DUF4180 domain-containing protein [Candidatus Neomarinimicrobiota bacterium]MBT4361778.1 DUF4180 domain-containing protein [Candidatus Neomarinimicrobiota bacterium]MBT4714466.1 DUF4180 domain-containing protein [Candidatus Neomarinimicrobiota bacterium]MBT4946167.1 DUF4180 domain-containing protein [Candidatus Neomarinimicrobiota bacterium]MBT5268966.1 DUF4180 domain-containing protein [Candidatus Neomarinimicrobiota bacterium]